MLIALWLPIDLQFAFCFISKCSFTCFTCVYFVLMSRAALKIRMRFHESKTIETPNAVQYNVDCSNTDGSFNHG